MDGRVHLGKLSIKLMALFLIVVFPLTVFSAFISISNYHSIRSTILKSINQNNQLISSAVDENMRNVFYSHSAMNVDDKIMYMIGAYDHVSDYQHYQNVREVLDRLAFMKLSMPIVSEIRLHIPSLNRSFLSNGTSIPLMEESQYYTEHIDHFFTIRAEKNTLALACAYPWLAGHNYHYYLVTEMDCQKLKNDILLRHTNGYDHVFLYRDDSVPSSQLITWCGDETLFDSFISLNIQVDGVQQIRIKNGDYLVSEVDIGFFGLKVLSLTPEAVVFCKLYQQRKAMAIAIAITIILILFFIQMIVRMINNPLRRLSDAFAQVQHGKLDAAIVSCGRNEFEEIYQRFNDMTAQMKQLINENYHSRLLAQETKMRQLLAQVNPHFLYNSFRCIHAMAQMEDYDSIEELTQKLTSFYRYTAKNSGEVVQLYQENTYACDYLSIQGIRFEDRLELRISPLPEELCDAPAMHFSIQTIAENACKYALPTRLEDGVIALSYLIHPDGYSVFVDDNGTAMTEEKIQELNQLLLSDEMPDTGTGLFNLHKRLILRWGENAGLRLSCSPLGGLRVEMFVRWKHKAVSSIHETRRNLHV